MRYYQLEDRKIPYEPGVNDESYINREFHFNPPSKVVATNEFKFIISDKGGLGETRNVNLDTDKAKQDLILHKDDFINIIGGKIVIDGK